jgi:hypothetical protein
MLYDLPVGLDWLAWRSIEIVDSSISSLDI